MLSVDDVQIRRGMRQELAAEDANGDVLGAAFADSMLPEGTLFMLSTLKRARAHKQRSDREFRLVEVEVGCMRLAIGCFF